MISVDASSIAPYEEDVVFSSLIVPVSFSSWLGMMTMAAPGVPPTLRRPQRITSTELYQKELETSMCLSQEF